MAPETETTSPDGEMEPTNVDLSCTSHKPLGFQPVNDLQDNSPAKRNSWSQTSQPPGHSYPISSKLKSPSQTSQPPAHSYHSSPKRNLSSLSSQPPTHSYPVTPSKPPTVIDIPTNNLPPTPDTTPVSSQSLKRTYSTALEVRLPGNDGADIEVASPSVRAGKHRLTHTQSGQYDGVLEAASPSVQASKYQRTHTQPSTQTTSSRSQSPSAVNLDTASPCHHRPKKHRTRHLAAPDSLPTPTQSPHRSSPFRTDLTPKFSIAYKPPASTEDVILWQELKLVAESVLGQVDWEVVAMDVGSNRSARRYKRAVREVLQEKIHEMVGRGSGG